MLGRALAVALLMTAAPTPSFAAESSSTVLFQSEASTPYGVSLELLDLYIGLHRRELLSLRHYENLEGLRVEEIMRRERLWFTPGFPQELDTLLCEINAPICRLRPSASQRFDRTYPTTWRLRPGDTVLIPDIELVAYLAPRAYRKEASEDLGDIVVHKTLGCDEFDDWCKQYIEALNHRADDVLNPAYSGTVIVPTLAIRGEFPLMPRPSTLEYQSLRDPLSRAAGSAGEPAPPAPRLLEASEEIEEEQPEPEALREPVRPSAARPAPAPPAPAATTAHEILEKDPELQRLLAPRIRVKMNSNHDPLEVHQTSLFELIHHPFARGQPIPGAEKMTVAVIDNWVDEEHCDFDRTFTFGNRGVRHVTRTECGAVTIEDPPLESMDHGTHVVGIIAARDNENGIVGVYPDAKVVTFEANYQDAVYASEVGQFINSPVIHPAEPPPRIDVFNISATYTPDQLPTDVDPISVRLAQFQHAKLLVAAAGNNEPGIDMSDGCRVWPACFRSRNLLSVVALNNQQDAPDILAKDGVYLSNYGTSFHVAAPGEAILSTIHGDRWGHMSGTSQATPVVAGAAAIVWSTDERLRPAHVKERLIATGDLFPALRDKVLGGRLNLERALDYKQDHLTLLQDGSVAEASGTLDYREIVTDASQPAVQQMLYWDDASGQRQSIQLRHVLRLRRDDPAEANGTWTLFVRDYATPPEQRDATPIRHDGIQILPTASKPLRLGTGDAVIQFQAPQVVDLVARLTQKFWHPE